ncbi:MAG: SDR family NAD(P)-dependent oxidoreductase [Alphaproteobacteria bacterium]|nr:SDR family NAD(P)-dependent oxidoreductase [Alphaproteobacteria bacterium]
MGALTGKIALVTGAGKNIGRAIALTLARDGATVAVNGRSDAGAVDEVVATIRAAGGSAVAVMGDVSDHEQARGVVGAAVQALGGLDILVSNAGLRRQTPYLEISLAEWREIMSVALDGAFFLSQAAIPHLLRRGGGAIVAMSGMSNHVGTPNRAHVSASKAGLEGLMRSLAVEFGGQNIRANCIAPGAIDTVRGASAGPLPGTLTLEGTPLGRRGTVDEIAGTVRLLVGPEGAYITGQTIHVNGGVYLT